MLEIPRSRSALLVGVLLAGLALLGGCAGGSPSNAPTGGTTASGSPSAPGPSFWPRGVAAAVSALGGADNEFRLAGLDLAAAADAEDPAALLAAADGLARLADENLENAELLSTSDDTRAAGEKTRAALIAIRDAAAGIRDSVRAGDGAGVEESSRDLAAAMEVYGEARVLVSRLLPEALRQLRALLQ